jgi:chloramphenicol-sensitive protein RarD
VFSPRDQKNGVIYALSAFTVWGLVPIYFKAIQQATPFEILCHRVAWTVPLTALLVTWSRDWKTLKTALSDKKVLITLFCTSGLIASNWFVFIYSVNTGHVLQASLGYYISPLVNVVMGVIFLRERLRPMQILAVLLALAGTFNLTVTYGVFPWISLYLAFTFGTYGLLRKTVAIEAVNGLFIETTLLLPFALGYLLFLGGKGELVFGVAGWGISTLIALSGAVTTVPLIWFTVAARRLRLMTLGLFQYIAPSLGFLLAVFLYHEPFTYAHLVTFVLIWTGLAIFMTDSFLVQRRYAKSILS